MKIILPIFLFVVLCGHAYAQNTVQKVAPVQQYQGYQDNIRQNAPATIPTGNAMGIQRVIPGNAIRDLSESKSISDRSGVIIRSTGQRKRNQQFIDQSLGRGQQLQNRNAQ